LVAMLGYCEEELLSRDFQSLTHPEDLQSDLALIGKVLTGELPSYQVEKRYLGRDGGIVYANLSVSLVRDRDGQPLYFVSQIENIAHRREMDRLKREFISTVSHELRTPLTSIRGSLGLVEGGVLGELPEKARAMVKIAHQNSERLVKIINDILDVEKIESGRLELHIGNVPIALLLHDALEYNAPYGEKYKVRFVLESAPPQAQVCADPDRLLQVLANLLSNAAKFSPPGAEVAVRAERRDNWIRVAVRDRGTGIPEEFRGRIFEKFAQADGSSARRFEGTGLGLNITQRLLEAMHGTIGFTTAIGEGTTFYFELPAASPDSVPAVDQRALTARYRVLSPVLERVPRILHVEDDRDLSQVIEAALAGRAELVTATTLKSAEDLLRAGDFALLVLDLGLPDGNGLALLDRLEELLPEPIPVVILSVSEVSQAVQQRVAASLVKSCLSEAEVVETILSLVAQEA
jgi:PAS domain S-box-containing protein